MRWAWVTAGVIALAGLVVAETGSVPPPKAAPPAKPAIEVRGRIAGEGGVPVPRAIVRVLPEPAAAKSKPVRVESAADGTFAAAGLSGATFRVRVEAKGYAPLTESAIPAGATLSLRLKRGHSVSGVVLDRATRKPIDLATVLAWEKDAEGWGEEAYRKAESAKDGRFKIGDLPAGKATFEARAPGRASARTAGLVQAPTPEKPTSPPVEILLDAAGTLSGRVTDTLGDPVAGAEVTAYWREAGADKSRAAKTGADGYYGIPAAAALRIVRMSVAARGFPSQERRGGIPSDGIVDFTLERGGTLTGTVKGVGSETAPPFRVSLRRERDEKREDARSRGASRAAGGEFSDPAGAFRLEDVDPGTYTVEITSEGFVTIKKTGIAVRAAMVEDLGTLTLESSTSLRGRVVFGTDRSPVAGATINVSLVEPAPAPAALSENHWSETSDSDGAFSIAGLSKGTYDVSAEQSSFAPVKLRVTFAPESSEEILLTMFRGGSLTGTVVDAKHEPVPGVRILATLGPEADARVADTGPDGQYFIDGLAPGTYQVMRQPRDPRSQPNGVGAKTAAIREGETTVVDFDEGPRIVMSGMVRKGEEPLANTPIYLFALDAGHSPLKAKKAQTDAAGMYRVGLDISGRYQASVRINATGAPGGQNVVMLNVPEQPEVTQDIVFAVNAIVGRVMNEEGSGVKGAIVLAAQDGASASNLRQSTTTTAGDGSFRLDAVGHGTYRLTARATGYAPAEAFPVEVSDAEPEPHVDLNLERGWLMRGRVLDPEGRPVNDATIVVAASGNSESGFLPSHTDASGQFRITAPADGPVNVGAISRRFAPAVQTDILPPGGDNAPEIVLRATPGGSMRIRVTHRSGKPAAGVHPMVRPVPLYPGADLMMDRNRPQPTDAEGTSVVMRLYPGAYIVGLVGRRDATPVEAMVGEGTESVVVLEIP